MARLENWEGNLFVSDLSWGDNGKGKAIDYLAEQADMVCRLNGGNNAGHTVDNQLGKFILHLISSGIFHPHVLNVLSGNVVVDPGSLVKEIDHLRSKGVAITGKNFIVADDAHLIMPWHKRRDQLNEVARGKGKIGTTGRGIGPTYGDRTERTGLRVRDLVSKDFDERFDEEFKWQERLVRLMSAGTSLRGRVTFVLGELPIFSQRFRPFDRKQILEEMHQAADALRPIVTSVIPIIYEYREAGKKILGEPGQGALLDKDRGTYPYVTSSQPGIAGFCAATGIPPKEVHTIGIVKAYFTRVGEGPFPTELKNETGAHIQKVGVEVGATTGRPRRTGWLDGPAASYGANVCGADASGLTKLDVLTGIKELQICSGYRHDGRIYTTAPGVDVEFMNQVEPVYTSLDGWTEDITQVTRYNDLPLNAKKYVRKAEEVIGRPLEFLSVGPSRRQTILL